MNMPVFYPVPWQSKGQGLHYNALGKSQLPAHARRTTTCVKNPRLRVGIEYDKNLAVTDVTGELGLTEY